MKTDFQIQKDVMDELQWEPFINSSDIGVAVKNGIVTLSGQVDSIARKLSAEKAAKRVAGVKAIAEDIQIGVSPSYSKTDAEIAEVVLNALKWHTAIPEGKVMVKVDNGVVTVDGEVEWEYQRLNVKSAIENLSGVRSVTSLIKVKPKITPSGIEQKINSAFHRSATIDADRITAEVVGSRVTLTGKVRSFAEKDDAESAAWAAPGVTSVINNLEIQISAYSFAD